MEIVLFGLGRTFEKFVITHSDDMEIKCIFDNKKSGEFCGINIERPFFQKNFYIIVTVDSYKMYGEIRKQLVYLGYCEFINFIPYQIYKKKMAIAYGNCHMDAVRLYLEGSKEFGKEYGFYPFPPVQRIEDEEILKVFSAADLIIHQAIRKENIFGSQYSSSNVLKNRKKECLLISVPNLFGLPKCLFPQLVKTPDRYICDNLIEGYDKNICNWYKTGISITEMVYMMKNQGIYDHSRIKREWDFFLKKVEIREKEWDIKIVDYIINNYQNKKLFYEPWHISTELAREIANKILRFLGMTFVDFIIPVLDDKEVFLYEDIKVALGIKYEEKTVRNYSRGYASLQSCPMDVTMYTEMMVNILKFESTYKLESNI